MARVYVNEGSTSYHPIAFFDKDGEPIPPESLRYRVTDSAGGELVAWTTIPNSSTEIEISAASNSIGVSGAKNRYLACEATHNGGDKITAEASYTLVDLKGVP